MPVPYVYSKHKTTASKESATTSNNTEAWKVLTITSENREEKKGSTGGGIRGGNISRNIRASFDLIQEIV